MQYLTHLRAWLASESWGELVVMRICAVALFAGAHANAHALSLQERCRSPPSSRNPRYFDTLEGGAPMGVDIQKLNHELPHTNGEEDDYEEAA